MQRRSRLAIRTTVVLAAASGSALLAGGACGHDSTAPNNVTAISVAVGDTIAGSFHAGDTIHDYAFAVQANTYYAVFVQALSGGVAVRVGYSGFEVPLVTTLALPGEPFDQRATDAFWAHVAGTIEVKIVKSVVNGPDASYRFVIVQIDPAPELRPPQFHLSDTVSGETLQSIADVDEFTFPGQAGQLTIAQVQALGPTGSGTIRLLVRGPDGSTVTVTSAGGDSTLAEQVSGPFTLPVTGSYAAFVTSVRGLAVSDKNYVGPYRFQVWALDSAPERAAAQVMIGDSITEEIRPIGDVDEFHLTGATGQEFNVFFQAMSGRATDLLWLDIPELVGGDPATAQSEGTDTSLLQHGVGRIRLPSTGPYSLRVKGAYDGPGGDRGPYRLYLYPIVRRPESARDSLTLGDSLTGETVGLPGDIDEYTLTVPRATLANLVLWREASGVGSLLILQLDPTNDCVNGLQAWPAAPGIAVGVGTGTFVLSAGSHKIQVCGESSGTGYRGGYRFLTFAIDSMPEHASDTVLVGDTVQESIDQVGDLDDFVFHARKGEHLTAYYQGLAPAATGSFYLSLTDSAGSILRGLYGANSTPQLSATRTSRYDAPVTGWYGLRVSPTQQGTSLGEVGPYRFALLDFPTGPEEAAATAAIGDSVAGERIDYDDDMDEFTVSGTPGTEFATYWQPVPGLSEVEIYDTTTQDTLRTMEDFLGGVQPAGRAVVPSSGVVGLRFTGVVGPYWFKTLAIDRAPETAPATVSVGDTVRTESIDPVSDVDEFTFSGNQGDTISALFDTPHGIEYPGLTLQVIDLATNSVLGSVVSYNPSNTFGDVRTGPIILPHTGPYRIRVEGVDDRYGRGIYTFLIKSGS